VAQVVWTETALNDIEGIRLQIANDSPQGAAAFVKRIFASSEDLELFPRLGRLIPYIERDDVREIIVLGHRVSTV